MDFNNFFSNLRSKATKTTPSITAKDQDSSQNTTDTLHATLASQESLATNREPGFRVDMNEHPEEPDQKQSSGLCYYNNLSYACTHVASAVGRRIFHINCPGVKEGQTHCENMSRGMMYPKVDGKCPDCLRDDDLMERAIYEHNLREKAARLVQSGRSRGMSISHILKVMVTRKDRMEPGLFDAIQEELKRTEPETERVAIKRQSIESPYVVVNQPNVPPDQSQQDIKVCDPLDGQVSDLTGNRCLDFISALPLPSFSIRSNNANTLTKLPQPRKVFSLHEQEKILSQNAAVKAIMQEQAGKEAAEAIPNIKGSAAMNIGKSLFQKGVSAWNTALKSEKHEGQVSQDGGVEARDVSSDSEDEDWVDVALLGGRRRGV